MDHLNAHAHGADSLPDIALAMPFAIVLFVYLWSVHLSRGRGHWPWHRSVFWIVGVTACLAAVAGPLAEKGHASFPAHMVGHLLLGMFGPVLLVLSAPLTLALRTLDPSWARLLVKVLASAPMRFVSHPVVAAVLNLGGLWILYSTALFAATHHYPAVHATVHVHVLVSGYLFTAAIIGIDPNRHRAGPVYRALVLVLFMAGHRLLAQQIFSFPPAGVPVDQAQVGAMVMYYGGDILDLAIILTLSYQWYNTRRATPSLRTGVARH